MVEQTKVVLTAPTVPNAELLADKDIPRVVAAGVEWPIPLLAPKQNRIVVPAMMRAAPKFIGFDVARASRDPDIFAKVLLAIDEATYDSMLQALYSALTRAHPTLKRTEFDDMPITTMELIQSLNTIAQQTGMMEKKRAEVPLGEAPAESESPPTGTP